MSLIRRTVTVTVLARSAGRDEYGDPITPTGVAHTISRCAVTPRTAVSTGEITERGREGVVEGGTLYAPTGADLLRTDRILLDHEGFPGVWELEGRVQRRRSLTGRAPGVTATIRRAEG